MRFNLWFDGECEQRNVDIGSLLCWLGELYDQIDVIVDIKFDLAGTEIYPKEVKE